MAFASSLDLKDLDFCPPHVNFVDKLLPVLSYQLLLNRCLIVLNLNILIHRT